MNWSVVLASAFTLFLWASAFSAIRLALQSGFSPGGLTFGRFLVASVTLLLFFIARGVPLPPRREWGWVVAIGVTGVTLYHLALNYGAQTVDAGTIAMIIATAPVYTAALAVLLLGERMRPLGWMGIAISFSGAMMIAMGKGGQLRLDHGPMLVLLAAVLSAIWAVMQRPVARRIGATSLTTWATISGTVLLLPWLGELIDSTKAATPAGIVAVVYLGIFPAALANALWSFALSRVPASRLAVFMYLMPPVTILIAWLLPPHEVPQRIALVGGAIAIVGVIVVNSSKGSTATKVAQQAVPMPAAGAGE